MSIDISNLDKAAVLAALYADARPQGMGFMWFVPGPLDAAEARSLLTDQTYFDYLHGRVMKVDLSGNEFDPRLYDRDNGDGAAARAVDSVRATAAAS